jgi:predicted LppA-like lipoprotein
MTAPMSSPTTRTAPHRCHRPLRAAAALVAAVAALLTTTACTTGPLGRPPMKTYAEIAARPRIDEAVARYEEMQQRIRDALDAEFGPLGWFQKRAESGSTCGHDVPPEFGGRSLSMAPWGFDSPIPDERWPRFRQVTADITGEYGFVTAGAAVDEPGHHLVNGIDPALGAHYELGSKRATLMQVHTGCHLPAGT